MFLSTIKSTSCSILFLHFLVVVAGLSGALAFLLIGWPFWVQTCSNCFTGMSLFACFVIGCYFLHSFFNSIFRWNQRRWLSRLSLRNNFTYIFFTFSYGDTSTFNYCLYFFLDLWCNSHVFFCCSPARSIHSLDVAFKYK